MIIVSISVSITSFPPLSFSLLVSIFHLQNDSKTFDHLTQIMEHNNRILNRFSTHQITIEHESN